MDGQERIHQEEITFDKQMSLKLWKKLTKRYICSISIMDQKIRHLEI